MGRDGPTPHHVWGVDGEGGADEADECGPFGSADDRRARLAIEPDRFSPLLQEFTITMLLGVEQAFEQAAGAVTGRGRSAPATWQSDSRRPGRCRGRRCGRAPGSWPCATDTTVCGFLRHRSAPREARGFAPRCLNVVNRGKNPGSGRHSPSGRWSQLATRQGLLNSAPTRTRT